MEAHHRSGPAAVISGLGGWLPARRVSNDDLATYLDTSDEWIASRTGIRARRVVDPGVATTDLAVEASRLALKSAGDGQVDALILATTTPDRRCPASAPDVASRLGLTGTAAYDVSAVCAGFLYGLATGAGLISARLADRVLVAGADTFSTILNPRDRTTVPIFGDGAGAVVLRAGDPAEPGALRAFDLGSDGEHSDLIMIAAGGSRRPHGTAARPEDQYFTMSGRDVYRHAVERMSASCLSVLDKVGWTVDEVDRLVAHQANLRITTALANRLGIRPQRCLSNIDEVGNTAAASVPLLLQHASQAGLLAPGQRVLLTAFGGGLAWGSAALIWPDLSSGRPSFATTGQANACLAHLLG